MTTELSHPAPAAALAPEPPTTGPPRNILGALRKRELTPLWSGQAISQTGTWMPLTLSVGWARKGAAYDAGGKSSCEKFESHDAIDPKKCACVS